MMIRGDVINFISGNVQLATGASVINLHNAFWCAYENMFSGYDFFDNAREVFTLSYGEWRWQQVHLVNCFTCEIFFVFNKMESL